MRMSNCSGQISKHRIHLVSSSPALTSADKVLQRKLGCGSWKFVKFVEDQPPIAPVTTVISIGSSSNLAAVIILPSSPGFIIEATVALSLGGAAATINQQTISVDSSGLQLINPPPSGTKSSPSSETPALIPAAGSATTINTQAAVGGVIASIMGISPSDPIITLESSLYTVSSANAGGVVVGRQTLASGGNIVVAGSTFSIAPGGSGIVVSGSVGGGSNATVSGEAPATFTSGGSKLRHFGAGTSGTIVLGLTIVWLAMIYA
ncbi:hypothetical protein VTL71DRAFT_12324 [Oculimacula yallundae]|uniref:Uncharacterized protein n=1 Tax=Oculimacula yallundae TaxID=86028 RepID=A0ABR4CPX3_9HELO